MSWASKECDWNELILSIQNEIDANKKIIPSEGIDDIQHYLDHGEYSMAFEYLYMEIAERENAVFTLGVDKAKELALFFELDNVDECMVDGEFWSKFQAFILRKRQ